MFKDVVEKFLGIFYKYSAQMWRIFRTEEIYCYNNNLLLVLIQELWTDMRDDQLHYYVLVSLLMLLIEAIRCLKLVQIFHTKYQRNAQK